MFLLVNSFCVSLVFHLIPAQRFLGLTAIKFFCAKKAGGSWSINSASSGRAASGGEASLWLGLERLLNCMHYSNYIECLQVYRQTIVCRQLFYCLQGCSDMFWAHSPDFPKL